MKLQKIITAAVGIFALLITGSALRAQSISMSYVTVAAPGDTANPADPATGSLYGSVSYAYDIGEYDVTDSQYCTFLNDVDPTGANTLGLYSGGIGTGVTSPDAEYGISYNSGAAVGFKYSVMTGYANMPVVDVDYWDTLRFANWMNNGEGNASTETGAYTLTGGTPTPSNSSSLLGNPQHNADATVWLPSENEWYKAAYYDPANQTYSTYATQSDTEPGNVVGNGADEANYAYYNGSQFVYSVTQSTSYNSSQNYLTAVGSFTDSASYYGTYDQAGDVFEWTGTVDDSGEPVQRGGCWNGTASDMSPPDRNDLFAPDEGANVGFRVAGIATASVPEPSTWAMMAAGVGALVAFRRRRRS
jgi:formylglycine-generating enzyme required for sulfatase activity